MTWTYDPTQLDTSTVYQVRLEVSDTDVSNQLLQDEEITRALDVEDGFWGAAARCCEIISRGFLRKADVQLGRDLKLTFNIAAKQYTDMATGLRAKAMGSALPYVGGRSVSEKLADSQDTDLVQPLFTKQTGVNPREGGVSTDPLQSWP